MSTPHHLSLNSLDMFVFELEEVVAQSKLAAFTFHVLVQNVSDEKSSHDLADLVVVRHKHMLMCLEEQLKYWHTLTLTDIEQEVIDYCQTLMVELYQLQQVFEYYEPLQSPNLH